MTTDERSAKERWESARLGDIPFYRPEIGTRDFIREMHESDYVSTAETLAGRKFGCNGIGKLTEVALYYPNEYSSFASNPQVRENPRFWQTLIGLPEKPPVDLRNTRLKPKRSGKPSR